MYEKGWKEKLNVGNINYRVGIICWHGDLQQMNR